MLSRLYYAGLSAVRLPALVRRLANGSVILCYHNVVRERDSARGDPAVHLSYQQFAGQVRWLTNHYRVVTLGEIVRRLARGLPLRGLVAVTFDDAYQGVFEHAWPLLLDIGIPATVFVVANTPARGDTYWWDRPGIAGHASAAIRERWLTELGGDGDAIVATVPDARAADPATPECRPAGWDTIAACAEAGFAIGVHSATHRTLPRLSDDELAEEIVGSWETIRKETGAAAEFFAYPYGRWDARARDAIRRAGYRGAVTLDPGLVTREADPWALPRVNVPAGISGPAFECWCAGLRPAGRDA